MFQIKPKQDRAINTERRFANALSVCLQKKSFHQTTIDDIALTAGLHRGAFLKRFGSKKNALFHLHHIYCSAAINEVERITNNTDYWGSPLQVCQETSMSLERIQVEHFAANRAMQEMFLEELTTDEMTKKIFLTTVRLLEKVQLHFFQGCKCTTTGAFAATQLLVTINYNYVLKSMPALPKDSGTRHRMIAECMLTALRH